MSRSPLLFRRALFLRVLFHRALFLRGIGCALRRSAGWPAYRWRRARRSGGNTTWRTRRRFVLGYLVADRRDRAKVCIDRLEIAVGQLRNVLPWHRRHDRATSHVLTT